MKKTTEYNIGRQACLQSQDAWNAENPYLSGRKYNDWNRGWNECFRQHFEKDFWEKFRKIQKEKTNDI